MTRRPWRIVVLAVALLLALWAAAVASGHADYGNFGVLLALALAALILSQLLAL